MASQPQSQTSAQPPPRRAHDPTQTTTYLIARITYLTSLITKSLLALTATSNPQHLRSMPGTDQDTDEEEQAFHPPIETADACMQIDAQTRYMIRAAEELRVLTETMRGMWLLGGDSSNMQAGEGEVDITNHAAAVDTNGRDVSDGREDIGDVEEKVVRGIGEYLRKRDLRYQSYEGKVQETIDDVEREDSVMKTQDG